MLKRILYHVIVLSAVLSLGSCGSSRTVTARGGGGQSTSSTRMPSTAGLHPTQQTLLREAERWLGTPYKYGGSDKGGVDCSGFVVRVYQDALDIKLPRTSRDQSDYCIPVAKSNLTPGDLVFFATTKGSKKVSHVGIYLGDNRMIHSSSSKGVIVSDFTTDYYTRAYAGAGTVGQYRAMLEPSTKGVKPSKPSRKDRRKKGRSEKPVPAPEPVVEPSPSRIAPAGQMLANGGGSVTSSQGITYTPVDKLPERAVPAVAEPEPETVAVPAPAPVSVAAAPAVASAPRAVVDPVTVADTPAEPVAEPSASDARSAVLNSLVEKKF